MDRTTRTVLIAVALVVIAVTLAGVAGVRWQEDAAARRNTDATPRYIDIWALYPDDEVRFVSRFHQALLANEEVQVVGPLVSSADVIQSAEALGGTIASTETLPGTEHDSNLVYNLYTLTRDAGEAPYGIDVRSTQSPYVTVSPDNPEERIFSIGTVPQDYYAQVVVAVALPADAEVVNSTPAAGEMESYRFATVAGWRVYYFDVTDASGAEAIRLTYRLPDSEPAALNPARIDRQR
jgi:hypothetical protein